MAEKATHEPEARIFVRESDGKTRKVTSETAAVAARFDGFFEQTSGGSGGKSTAAKAATGGDSTKAANNAG
jgi:hypothetical protein